VANDRFKSSFLPAVLALLAAPAVVARADRSPYEWALIQLDYARQQKAQELRAFCDRVHALAQKMAQDALVLSCFDINRKYSEALEKGAIPEALSTSVAQLREGFRSYYIDNYLAFYDILFVDLQGNVFYTIRKESDLNQNVLRDHVRTGALSDCLKTKPTREAFLDFCNYGPSSEPAAFFVEPVYKENDLNGWIVLQCAVNKLNTLFAWTDSLGKTGETFLVNREGFMPTESNFEGSSTILAKRLDDRNIQAKFSEGRGHRTVTDYRGYTALTSFEVVEFLGTSWLVVAKMDKHEIITRYYAQHRRYFGDRLLDYLRDAPLPKLRDDPPTKAKKVLRVDMDEFVKADHGERLRTFGISTCTGFLAAYQGRFAYLAHISPKDKIYGSDDTNLLGKMLKKIKTFDVYPCDTHRIVFVVVATHLDSLLAIVDKLVEEGFLLSQIRMMYNPRAHSGGISYDPLQNDLRVDWRLPKTPDVRRVHRMVDATSLEEIIQHVMASEGRGTMPGVSADAADATQE